MWWSARQVEERGLNSFLCCCSATRTLPSNSTSLETVRSSAAMWSYRPHLLFLILLASPTWVFGFYYGLLLKEATSIIHFFGNVTCLKGHPFIFDITVEEDDIGRFNDDFVFYERRSRSNDAGVGFYERNATLYGDGFFNLGYYDFRFTVKHTCHHSEGYRWLFNHFETQAAIINGVYDVKLDIVLDGWPGQCSYYMKV
ncbi:unnamed protein product [Caenorhabditis sp. 36 PRJEB53466]|nr:unnamed protein product [Caenorhabditis sp. 36 PRJEB53466]